jgi:hypothetical protein
MLFGTRDLITSSRSKHITDQGITHRLGHK